MRLRISAPVKQSDEGPALEEEVTPPRPEATPSARTQRSQATLQRRQEQAARINELAASGQSIYAIASQLHLARNTVRRYLRTEAEIQIAPRPRSKSVLDLHYDYLNARRLFEELQQRGYRGCEATVRNFVARLRKDLPGMARPPRKTATGHTPASSPREIRWLLAQRENDLEPEERTDLARLLAHSPEAKLFHQLVQDFLGMLRERQEHQLDGWMQEARNNDIKEMISFVAGIERDYDAVRAGLRLTWSQGPVEGTVNKIKTHKRLMYGRASFKLLRLKMLHQKVT